MKKNSEFRYASGQFLLVQFILLLFSLIQNNVKGQIQFNMQHWTGAWGSDGPIKTGDLNGDKKTDVFMWRQSDNSWTVNLSTGSGFNMQRWTGAWGSDGPIKTGDLNGDKKMDVFMWRQSDNSWTVNLSTGSGFNMQRWTGAWGSDGPINVGDLNGDKKMDVFMWRQSDNSWTVNLSTGTGFNMQRWTGAWGSDGPINVGDLNSDGKTDVFMWRKSDNSWTVNLSTGTGFNMQRWTGAWGSDGPINTGDLNGDGNTDVFMWRGSDNAWTVNLSTGSGFNMLRLTGAWGSDGPINTGDLNGDGNTDVFMWRGSDNAWTVNLSTLVNSSSGNINNPTKLLVTNYNNGPNRIKDNCEINSQYKWPACYCNNDSFPRGVDNEWVPIPDPNNFTEYRTYGLSGITVFEKISGADLPWLHPFGYNSNDPNNPFFYDWESFIVPDSQYRNLLALSNANSGEYDSAAKAANSLGLNDNNFKGTMGTEIDNGLIPFEYRSLVGDRTAVFGRLVVDCGHGDYHTEIHPPLLIANARPLVGMNKNKQINKNWKSPDNIKHVTYTSVISRPFLVSQKFKTTLYDDVSFMKALLGEIMAACNPAGIAYKMGLDVKIHNTPFDAIKLLSFDVFPTTPRTDLYDKLWVDFHFTVRTGITVNIINKDNYITVLITMNSSLYNQNINKSSVRFLKRHDWIIPKERVLKLDRDYFDAMGAGTFFGATINPFFGISLESGISASTYENPIPHSNFDQNVFNLETVGQHFDISDDQPFPIYGWMAVGWVPGLKPTDIPYISPCATNYNPKTSYRPITIESLDGSTEFSIANNNKTFRITNTGTGTVKITRIRLAGNYTGSFKMKIPVVLATNDEFVLGPGQSQTFTVLYSPGGEGSSEATIEVVTDIFKECPYKTPISGFIIR